MRIHGFLRAATVAGCCGLALGEASAAETCRLEDDTRAGVTRVVDGETLALDDGRTLRLAGALATKPDDPSAVRALEALVAGRTLALRTDGRRSDRYGRVLAQAFLVPLGEAGGEEVWVQNRLVRDGMARASALPGNGTCLALLLAAEREARLTRRGLWRDVRYRVRAADDARALMSLVGQFALVAGRVAGVTRTRQTVFINFGADWRRDFTATLPGRIAEKSEEEAGWLLALEGKSVRVRGWIERRNGPLIALGSADEIEVLEEGEAAP
ncbi:MAG: thermonuclease family protein [Hyphomicrobium sp.]|uniref:thermonuclease family protein n=1 Tax=Hyphomicrobium sp. TaxID=82 RepID=UPI003D0A13A6